MCKKFFFILVCLAAASVVTAQPSKRASALYESGVKSAEKAMYPEAMVSFKKAIALNKIYDSAYVEMGNIYLRTSKPDSAIFYFNKAITINPRMVTALLSLGNVYRDFKRNHDSAITCYLIALEVDSLNKVACYGLAWCYNSRKDYDNAIKYATRSLDIDYNYKDGYNELGHAYNASKRYTEGVMQFKKYIALANNDLAIIYCGLCYIQLKDKEGALEMYEQLKKMGSKRAETLKKRIDAMQ